MKEGKGDEGGREKMKERTERMGEERRGRERWGKKGGNEGGDEVEKKTMRV